MPRHQKLKCSYNLKAKSYNIQVVITRRWERSGSVVEWLTGD